MGSDNPLSVAIEGGELVIRMGVQTVADAFEQHESNNPYDDEGHFVRQFEVADVNAFARDVVNEMEDEAEDGSSPLIRFLDDMGVAAAENGSLAMTESGKIVA